MRIPHGHRQTRMAQDALKRDDVSAFLEEVASEGVAQCVRCLPLR